MREGDGRHRRAQHDVEILEQRLQRARKPLRTRPVLIQDAWVIVKPRRRAAAILKSSGDSACAAASTRSRSSGARSVLKNADSSST